MRLQPPVAQNPRAYCASQQLLLKLGMQNARSDRKASPSAASSCLPEPKCSSWADSLSKLMLAQWRALLYDAARPSILARPG
jgi:hypothetical protein